MWKITRPDSIAILSNKLAKKSLARYLSAMQNQKPAKFIIAKNLPAKFCKKDSLEKLWGEHERILQTFHETEHKIDSGQSLTTLPANTRSFLDLKIEIANKILSYCHFCQHRCGVNRLNGALGFCSCGSTLSVSRIFEHLGEEAELVPSGTIFTMGCTMRCLHCQNWTISQWRENFHKLEPCEVAREIERLRKKGCRNINLVGGDPTPWVTQWLETFKHVTMNVPIVWNSNSYYTPETAHLLSGFADIYLLDFKYGPANCAKKISNATNYWKACTRNHLEAKEYGELIIRVLVLPNHLVCCTKPILNWIAEHLGSETRVNLLFQYRPEWKACEIPEIGRSLNEDEMQQATKYALQAGLKNLV
jgi:putative pyruvate formate lyase activating enzyme